MVKTYSEREKIFPQFLISQAAEGTKMEVQFFIILPE